MHGNGANRDRAASGRRNRLQWLVPTALATVAVIASVALSSLVADPAAPVTKTVAPGTPPAEPDAAAPDDVLEGISGPPEQHERAAPHASPPAEEEPSTPTPPSQQERPARDVPRESDQAAEPPATLTAVDETIDHDAARENLARAIGYRADGPAFAGKLSEIDRQVRYAAALSEARKLEEAGRLAAAVSRYTEALRVAEPAGRPEVEKRLRALLERLEAAGSAAPKGGR
jgi:hypothetical protein